MAMFDCMASAKPMDGGHFGAFYEGDGDSWTTFYVVGTGCIDEVDARWRAVDVYDIGFAGHYGGAGRSFAFEAYLECVPFVGWIVSQSGGLDI